MIARDFLLKTDTSLAIATLGLRTSLLFEKPPFRKPPIRFSQNATPAKVWALPDKENLGEGKWGRTKYRRIPESEGDWKGRVPKCSVALENSLQQGIWSSLFWRDLSQVVRRTPWDTPVPFYTRTSPSPNNGCWKVGPTFGNAPGYSPPRLPQPS